MGRIFGLSRLVQQQAAATTAVNNNKKPIQLIVRNVSSTTSQLLQPGRIVVINGCLPLLQKQQQQQQQQKSTNQCFRTFSSPPETKKPLVLGVGKGKTSTGIVGLAVEPDWYNVMLQRFQALLDKLEASDMPVTAEYRMNVTKWCNYVIKVTKENPEDPEAVEDAVNLGQVEELIEMAEDEMIAMDCYLECRMWELVEEMNPSIVVNPNPMDDIMADDGDPDEKESLRKGVERQQQQQEEKK